MAGFLRDAPVSAPVLINDPLEAEAVPSAAAVAKFSTGPFKQGLRAATLGSEANSYMTRSMQAAASGDQQQAAYWKTQADLVAQEAGAAAPSVTSYKDVNSVGTGYDFAAGAAGQAAGSSINPAIGGMLGGTLLPLALAVHPATRPFAKMTGLRSPAVLGGALGSGIPGYQMERDEAVMGASRDPTIMATRTPQEILNTAAVKGAINMIPETVVPTLAAAKVAGRVMKPFAKTTAANVAGGVALNAGAEAGTETFQTKVGQLAQSRLNPLRDTSGDTEELINAGISGGIGGPVIGAPGTVADLAGVMTSRTKQAGSTLGEALSSKDYGEAIGNLIEDRVPQDVVKKGATAVQEYLSGLEPRRAGEVIRELAERVGDSETGQKAGELLQRLNDPAQRESAYEEAKKFVVEDMKGRQAVEKGKKLYATATQAAKDFYAGYQSEDGSKKNAQRELDATDRALDEVLKPAFGDSEGGTLFAPIMRDVLRDPLKDRGTTVRMVQRTIEHLGQEAQSVLVSAYEVLQRDGATPEHLATVASFIRKVDSQMKELAESPSRLAREFQKLMPSAQREAVAAQLGHPVSQQEFSRIASIALDVYKEGTDPAPVREFFGENADRALKLAEAAAANLKQNWSITAAGEEKSPEKAPLDSDEVVDTDNSAAFDAKQDELAKKVATDEVFSFRDGRTRVTKNPYGTKDPVSGKLVGDPLYDVKADADLIQKRLDPEGDFAKLYRSQAARTPTLLPANDYADRLGLDRKQLAAPYTADKNPPATEAEARRLLEGKAVIEAMPLSTADPTEYDRNAVERVTSGKNAVTRPTREFDEKRKDERYFVVKDQGVTNITNAGPDEGMLWLRAADKDGAPATHKGEPKYLRLDMRLLIREAQRRANAMRRLEPAAAKEDPDAEPTTTDRDTRGEALLNHAVEGLVGILTTPGNGVHAESGVFAYRKGGLKEVIMGNAKVGTDTRVLPLLPYDLRLQGTRTVGSVLNMTEEQYKQRANALLRSPQVLKAKGDAFRALAASDEYQAMLRQREEEAQREEGQSAAPPMQTVSVPMFDQSTKDERGLPKAVGRREVPLAETTDVEKRQDKRVKDQGLDYLFPTVDDMETGRQTEEVDAARKEVEVRTREAAPPKNAPASEEKPAARRMEPAGVKDKKRNLVNTLKKLQAAEDDLVAYREQVAELGKPPTAFIKRKIAALEASINEYTRAAERIYASIDEEFRPRTMREAKPGTPETQKTAPIKQMTAEERKAEVKPEHLIDKRRFSKQDEAPAAITSFQGENRFLSNFHPTPVVLDGVTYPTVEHAYQAAKTTNKAARERVLASASPGVAKRVGKTVPMRADWEAVKIGVMKDLVTQKFKDPALAKLLLATGDARLIEGNTWGDRFWGAAPNAQGKLSGQNHLGVILREVRDELRGQQEAPKAEEDDHKHPRVEVTEHYTRAEIKANPDKVYVFGDNMQGKGLGGQAAAARGEPNALGIPTKYAPTMAESAFFGRDPAKEKAAITTAVDKIIAARDAGKTVVLPKGIGLGRAQLDSRAPEVYAHLRKELGRIYYAQPDLQSEGKHEPFKGRKEAEAYLHRALGKNIEVIFRKTLGGWAGDWTPGDTVNTIRISMSASSGALSVAFHESLHELFSRLGKQGQKDTQELLKRVASAPMVQRQLERLLAEHPAAFASMKADPEERVAYAFQFWASAKHGGPKFTVGPETDSFFQRVVTFIKGVLGLLSEDERAAEIFEAFYDGKMADDQAMKKVLAGFLEDDRQGKTLRDLYGAVTKPLMRHVMPAHDRLLESGNPHLVEIAKLFHNAPTTDGGGEVQGYLNARSQQTAQWLNRLSTELEKHDAETIRLAAEHLTGVKKGMPAYGPARDIVEKTRAFLSRGDKSFLKYLQDAGVPVKNLSDFFPRVWNMDAIGADPKKFEALLMKHHEKDLQELADYSFKKALEHWAKTPEESRSAKPKRADYTAEGVAEAITTTLSTQNGVLDEDIERDLEVGKAALGEKEDRLGFTPYMAAVNTRKLKFLDMTKFGDYIHKDYLAVMGSYVEQGVRRAEYARRFGNTGEGLRSTLDKAADFERVKLLDGRRLKDLKPEERDKITQASLKEVATYTKEIMAMEGTLGHDLSPTSRKWMSWVVVYQNARILPLALFSSLIDAQGILVRGGSVGDAFKTLATGFREIGEQFRSRENQLARKTSAARFAETMGTVDNAIMQDAIQQAYSGMYMHGAAKRINDRIFKWNGMEAWNRGMRIGATQAAVGFFKEQKLNAGEHTERWLAELGVRSDDIQFNSDGSMKFTVEEGLAPDAANRMRAGLQKWVDGAILRPNSAQRPAWASDPHWVLIFHLKQFTYSFHTTILRHIMKEAKYGNLMPAVAFTSYIPVMLAADVLRGMVMSGGGEPPWKKDWGPAEYLGYATERAGTFGLWQFAKDAYEFGPWTLGGPTADQILKGVVDPLDKTALNAMPQVTKQVATSMMQD